MKNKKIELIDLLIWMIAGIAIILFVIFLNGCSLQHRINIKAAKINQAIVDKCMAKYHDQRKCTQLTYPSCEPNWEGQECHR